MLKKKSTIAIVYFLLSTLITWWFIRAAPIYTSLQQQLLSCGIAGAKWGVQLLAALMLLRENKWHFIKNIGLTCLTGSMILVPYAILSNTSGINGTGFFVASLLTAVAVMILFYALSVKNAGLKIYWWAGWMICLAIAILLQLTMVFHVL